MKCALGDQKLEIVVKNDPERCAVQGVGFWVSLQARVCHFLVDTWGPSI